MSSIPKFWSAVALLAVQKNIFQEPRSDEQPRRANNDPRQKQPRQNNQPRRDKRDVHGWVVLDKPIGMTSTHAVAVLKRLFQAKRAGHAGTLDPLASGGLPIALGEATKTVPFVMDGRKRYRFTVSWGEERDTDDTEGRATKTSELRPSAEAIRELLPQFTVHARDWFEGQPIGRTAKELRKLADDSIIGDMTLHTFEKKVSDAKKLLLAK